MFTKGETLYHKTIKKKCIFKEYEVEGCYSDWDCAWVIFPKTWFRKEKEVLVWNDNLIRI